MGLYERQSTKSRGVPIAAVWLHFTDNFMDLSISIVCHLCFTFDWFLNSNESAY